MSLRLGASSPGDDLGDDAARVRFVEGTTASPEVVVDADRSFNAIHCSMVLMFVEGDEAKLATLVALRRMLSPGGVIVQTEVLADSDEHETFALWRAFGAPTTNRSSPQSDKYMRSCIVGTRARTAHFWALLALRR